MISNKQLCISDELGVRLNFDVKREVISIVEFLVEYALRSKTNGFILGVSGGQDSTLCGKLAQMATMRIIAEHNLPSSLYGIRLPYGNQVDADDAELASDWIQPTKRLTYNIEAEVQAVAASYQKLFGKPLSDFAKGNVKARARMVIQYAIAGENNLLVLGTDHAAEAITGFYTKFGDGAADLTPLSGLTKRRGKAMLQALGCPERLYQKTPTADLEDNRPALPDEVALGVAYNQIDDYLELKEVDKEVAEKIERWYDGTKHKRNLPVTRFDLWR